MYRGYFCTWRLTARCVPCAAGSPLQLLRAHGNYLNGSLPASLGALPALQELDLFNNTLTGSLPPAVQGMPSPKPRSLRRPLSVPPALCRGLPCPAAEPAGVHAHTSLSRRSCAEALPALGHNPCQCCQHSSLCALPYSLDSRYRLRCSKGFRQCLMTGFCTSAALKPRAGGLQEHCKTSGR